MKINAKLNKITNEKQFIASFIKTGGKPTAGFTNFGAARIHLATDFPLGKFPDEASFIPTISLKTDADSKGNFSFNIPAGMNNSRGYLIAYEKVGTAQPFPNIPPIPIFQAVYRSETFKLNAVKETLKNIFLEKKVTADKDGFTQKQVDKEAAKFRTDNHLDKVSATVRENRLSSRISERGAESTFNIRLRADTSHALDKFIETNADEIEIDLPGPDFIVGICVSKDDIENRLRKLIKGLSKFIDANIVEAIPSALKPFASFTVHQIRFPVTGEFVVKLPNNTEHHIPTRSIVPDITVGVPKKLF